MVQKKEANEPVIVEADANCRSRSSAPTARTLKSRAMRREDVRSSANSKKKNK